MRVILASKSPRRKELLASMGVTFDVIVSGKDEIVPDGTKIHDVPKILAEQKAENVFDKTSGDRVIIGSDTIVALGGVIYGKPNKDKSAFQMLRELSGKTHEVITGLCVIIERNGKLKKYSEYVITKVKFKRLSDAEIQYYVDTHEPDDKAGAYGIQGKAGMFVEKIDGNFASVVGLPTYNLYKILKKEHIIDIN